MSKIYNVFFIFGYESVDEKGNFQKSTEYQIISDSLEDAMTQLKAIQEHKEYHFKKLIQKYRE